MCYERIYLAGIVFPDNVQHIIPTGPTYSEASALAERESPGFKIPNSNLPSCSSTAAPALKISQLFKNIGTGPKAKVHWSKVLLAQKHSDNRNFTNKNIQICPASFSAARALKLFPHFQTLGTGPKAIVKWRKWKCNRKNILMKR